MADRQLHLGAFMRPWESIPLDDAIPTPIGDTTDFDVDGVLPEIPESNARKSGRERFVSLAKRDNLTVR